MNVGAVDYGGLIKSASLDNLNKFLPQTSAQTLYNPMTGTQQPTTTAPAPYGTGKGVFPVGNVLATTTTAPAPAPVKEQITEWLSEPVTLGRFSTTRKMALIAGGAALLVVSILLRGK